MEGITAIAQRMAQIQSIVAPRPPAASAGAAGTAVSASGTAFSDLLAQEVARTAATASTAATAAAGTSTAGTPTAGQSAATRLGGDGVPTELAAYGNGKIPPAALQEVGTTGHRLWAPAAQALTGLITAAAADGVKVGITDSYRSYAGQVDVAQRKGLYSQGGLAAAPGTSDHGWGLAVDLDLDATAQAWMRAHGAEHGFVEDTPREPWHWAYTP
ncbi:M15 family metallopeptidase [Cellulomonas fengjieae]|uniref:M15 family metallopeptidase n=1 Tax=Cellulomonas fengjieae TaxID=2819978 RepID=A0ABS3SGQ1_9CELL|nr:M15 family metallopeptidase [Cellulomonas fengjieae]MBO3084930.1 M15 family metallopeptidase [Cellulomonas fengjieae]QVI66468.1 M15 family metallopeptidase [Cellulomonas fengjieae]